ncbi:unnamed protein product [Caenorhabditis nigoni]
MSTFLHLLFSAETSVEVHHRVLTNSPVLVMLSAYHCQGFYSRCNFGKLNPAFFESANEIFVPIRFIITVRGVCEPFIPKTRANRPYETHCCKTIAGKSHFHNLSGTSRQKLKQSTSSKGREPLKKISKERSLSPNVQPDTVSKKPTQDMSTSFIVRHQPRSEQLHNKQFLFNIIGRQANSKKMNIVNLPRFLFRTHILPHHRCEDINVESKNSHHDEEEVVVEDFIRASTNNRKKLPKNMHTETKTPCVIFKYCLHVSVSVSFKSNAGMHERIRQSDEQAASRIQNALAQHDSEPKRSFKLFSNVKAYIEHTDS